MSILEKPIARSVPISAVRAWTEAYIAFAAPKLAPKPAITATKSTITKSVRADSA